MLNSNQNPALNGTAANNEKQTVKLQPCNISKVHITTKTTDNTSTTIFLGGCYSSISLVKNNLQKDDFFINFSDGVHTSQRTINCNISDLYNLFCGLKSVLENENININ